MEQTKIRPAFSTHQTADDAFVLLGESQYQILDTVVFARLLPLLDGNHSIGKIVDKLSDVATFPEVLFALRSLTYRGVVDVPISELSPAEDALWAGMRTSAAKAREKLASMSAEIVTIGNISDSTLEQDALQGMGVQVSDAKADVKIVLTDDYMRPELEAINAAAIASKQPWLLVKPVGSTVWIGPFFEPGTTGCWHCLTQRLEKNRQIETFLRHHHDSKEPFPVSSKITLPTTRQLAAQMIANSIVRWMATSTHPTLLGKMTTLDTWTMETESHQLVKQPQCKSCGDQALRTRLAAYPDPIELQPCPKRYRTDGGHRHLFPEETLARNEHHISRHLGIVSYLDEAGDDKGLVFSTRAGHNFALAQQDVLNLRDNLRTIAGGKGKTRTQAKVSGICEAIERYSGAYEVELLHEIRGNYTSLGDDALHYDAFLLFSEQQYATRNAFNPTLTAPFHLVPNKYDNREIGWTPMWSLTKKRHLLLPASFAYYGHPELHYYYSSSDSNGCAAGNTLEEAAYQGLLELIERDAVAIWWYNQIQRPGVDLDSFNQPYFGRAAAYYHSQNRTLDIIDLTTDLGVPVFAALSARLDGDTDDIIMGFGAHLDPGIAASRAITELHQSLVCVAGRNPDGSTQYIQFDQNAIDWIRATKQIDNPYLTPSPHHTSSSTDFERHDSDDIRDDVELLIDRLAAEGLETFILDQTRPEVDIHVVRMVVPGLRHMWRRLAPGRLYDVPVKLGWLDAPKQEHELNPFSVYF